MSIINDINNWYIVNGISPNMKIISDLIYSYMTLYGQMSPFFLPNHIWLFLCEQISSYVIAYFDTTGQNGRLAHCKCENAAMSESPVWPHESNHILLYKFMRTGVGSPFTDIENSRQLNVTR